MFAIKHRALNWFPKKEGTDFLLSSVPDATNENKGKQHEGGTSKKVSPERKVFASFAQW